MAVNFYDDRGIRFEFPHDWEIEISHDGPRSSMSVQSPNGPAFALLTIDADRPAPKDVISEALTALQEDYPQLEVSSSNETIDGHTTLGNDIEFFAMDMTHSCSLRCFRTPRRTVFIMAQWCDTDANDPEPLLRAVWSSVEETDS